MFLPEQTHVSCDLPNAEMQRHPGDSAFWGHADDPEVLGVCITEFCVQRGAQNEQLGPQGRRGLWWVVAPAPPPRPRDRARRRGSGAFSRGTGQGLALTASPGDTVPTSSGFASTAFGRRGPGRHTLGGEGCGHERRPCAGGTGWRGAVSQRPGTKASRGRDPGDLPPPRGRPPTRPFVGSAGSQTGVPSCPAIGGAQELHFGGPPDAGCSPAASSGLGHRLSLQVG